MRSATRTARTAAKTAEGTEGIGLTSEAAASTEIAEEGFEEVAVYAAAEVLAIEIEVEILEARAAGELLAVLPVGAELIVHTALFVILEDFVGFVDVFELVLGGLVAGVEIGMVLAGELLVRLGYLFFAGRAFHAQQLIHLQYLFSSDFLGKINLGRHNGSAFRFFFYYIPIMS